MKKAIILLIGLLLLCAGCSNAQEDELSFPSELFSAQAVEDADVECGIQIEEMEVELIQNGNDIQAILHLSGSLPEKCSNMSVRLDPPTVYKRINVYLIAYASTESNSSDLKPFDISISIPDLQSGSYHILVNEQSRIDFEIPFQE